MLGKKRFLTRTPPDPGQLRQQRVDHWQRKWNKRIARRERKANHPVATTVIPDPIQRAVAEKWFPEEASLLDVCCGKGHISSWLAGQGLTVLGIDFILRATQLARRMFAATSSKLSFETADICQKNLALGHFDVVLDSGCFHGIPAELWPFYLENVSRCLAPGGRFLLLRTGTDAAVIAGMEALFQTAFDIRQIEQVANIRGNEDRDDDRIPGLAFWMVRQ